MSLHSRLEGIRSEARVRKVAREASRVLTDLDASAFLERRCRYGPAIERVAGLALFKVRPLTEGLLDTLCQLMGDGDPLVRLHLLGVLMPYSLQPSVNRVLVAATKDADGLVRVAALNILNPPIPRKSIAKTKPVKEG